ncbi:uncharacterized protein LOC141620204 [Silene latifolia]|uniref:uncharacterized protein LOC141620204 n=1 Tax=Silene latifolia TaxID=37657 RepID=UPI003D777373
MTGPLIIGEGDGKKGDSSGKKRDTIPMSSPLYLHPSDGPALSLTQIKFDGENYELWADAIRNGLDAKNKLAFVEGTIEKPITLPGEEESLEAVAWRQCNAMVKAWLRSAIEIRLHSSTTFSGTVPEIWKELKERYATGNAPRVHQLKAELNECKQEKHQSIVDYYTKLKSIWDELGNYSKVPSCTCGAAAFFIKEREEEKVHQFLMGLDTVKYGHIRSNLLMEDEVTSLSRAYALVLREERHGAITKGKEEVIEAAMDQTWYPARGRGRGGRGQGRGGRGNDFQRANAASTNEADAHCSDLTAEEISRVRSLLTGKTCGNQNQKASGMLFGNWMIDSGASHHMTGRHELLHQRHNGRTSTVGLPNGSHILANEYGNDQSMRMKIGRGELKDGVYYLKNDREDTVAKASTKVDTRLWHRRLGHPSSNNIEHNGKRKPNEEEFCKDVEAKFTPMLVEFKNRGSSDIL